MDSFGFDSYLFEVASGLLLALQHVVEDGDGGPP